MELGALRKDRGAEGDSEAASKVSHKVENSGRVAHLFHRDINVSCGRQGDKKQPEPKTLYQPRHGYRVKISLEVEIRHHP